MRHQCIFKEDKTMFFEFEEPERNDFLCGVFRKSNHLNVFKMILINIIHRLMSKGIIRILK